VGITDENATYNILKVRPNPCTYALFVAILYHIGNSSLWKFEKV